MATFVHLMPETLSSLAVDFTWAQFTLTTKLPGHCTQPVTFFSQSLQTLLQNSRAGVNVAVIFNKKGEVNRRGNYLAIRTEPEVNNCFTLYEEVEEN